MKGGPYLHDIAGNNTGHARANLEDMIITVKFLVASNQKKAHQAPNDTPAFSRPSVGVEQCITCPRHLGHHRRLCSRV